MHSFSLQLNPDPVSGAGSPSPGRHAPPPRAQGAGSWSQKPSQVLNFTQHPDTGCRHVTCPCNVLYLHSKTMPPPIWCLITQLLKSPLCFLQLTPTDNTPVSQHTPMGSMQPLCHSTCHSLLPLMAGAGAGGNTAPLPQHPVLHHCSRGQHGGVLTKPPRCIP